MSSEQGARKERGRSERPPSSGRPPRRARGALHRDQAARAVGPGASSIGSESARWGRQRGRVGVFRGLSDSLYMFPLTSLSNF